MIILLSKLLTAQLTIIILYYDKTIIIILFRMMHSMHGPLRHNDIRGLNTYHCRCFIVIENHILRDLVWYLWDFLCIIYYYITLELLIHAHHETRPHLHLFILPPNKYLKIFNDNNYANTVHITVLANTQLRLILLWPPFQNLYM